MVPTDFKTLIQRFYHLQAERVETYQLFEEGHEAYLRTGPHYDFDHYRQLVHEITQAFCGISTEVLQIKEKLHRDFDRPDLSEHMDKLQSKEKHKLELTWLPDQRTTPLYSNPGWPAELQKKRCIVSLQLWSLFLMGSCKLNLSL
ncbi:required for excision 1-B domain-containing protein isoform X2 [Genypterus blacodes]|uniref:required for excision 1-B domain-containing protein isoform X2 n=1 Tax=Genypterus blacodes TaxID=154954 RepID=UPI003F767D8D